MGLKQGWSKIVDGGEVTHAIEALENINGVIITVSLRVDRSGRFPVLSGRTTAEKWNPVSLERMPWASHPWKTTPEDTTNLGTLLLQSLYVLDSLIERADRAAQETKEA
jgi:hypothetical protein